MLIFSFPSVFTENENINKTITSYLHGIKEFSSGFIQSNGNTIEEGKLYLKNNRLKIQYTDPSNITIIIEKISNEKSSFDLGFGSKDVDTLYEKALTLVLDQQKVSTSFIQRYLQIGYNRAARIVEKMEEDGFISEPSHAGKRSVLKKNK